MKGPFWWACLALIAVDAQSKEEVKLCPIEHNLGSKSDGSKLPTSRLRSVRTIITAASSDHLIPPLALDSVTPGSSDYPVIVRVCRVTQLAKLQGVDHIDIPQRVSAADRHRLVVEASPPHLGAFVGRAYARSITIAYVAASLLQE